MPSSTNERSDSTLAPKGRVHLNQRIRMFARQHSVAPNFAAALLANCIVLLATQAAGLDSSRGMLVKGGVRFAVRNDLASTRFTTDLDVSTSASQTTLEMENLAGATVGAFKLESVKRVQTARPKNLPEHYAVRRYKIRLTFMGGEFRTVVMEVNQNELGLDREFEDLQLSNQLVGLLQLAGLKPPATLRAFSSEYQFAQKLHALSEPGSDRGHDLFDLWLLITMEHLDTLRLRELVNRTFAIRQTHTFALPIITSEVLERTYVSAVADLNSPPSFETALKAMNDYLTKVFSS